MTMILLHPILEMHFPTLVIVLALASAIYPPLIFVQAFSVQRLKPITAATTISKWPSPYHEHLSYRCSRRACGRTFGVNGRGYCGRPRVGDGALVERYSSLTEEPAEGIEKTNAAVPTQAEFSTENEGHSTAVDLAGQADDQDPTGFFSLSRNCEFWLDLRETAISPREALTFLQEQLVEEPDNDDPGARQDGETLLDLVDRVLLSEEGFFKFVEASDDADYFSERDIDIFYATAGSRELIASDGKKQQSFPFGKIMACEPDSILDPLVALEATTGGSAPRGGWVVIECEKDQVDASESSSSLWFEEQVSSLIEFLSASAATSSALTDTTTATAASGLFVPGALRTDGSGSPSDLATGTITGGIAVCCRTRASMLQLDTAMKRSVCTNAMITSTTESGLLLPTGMMNNHRGSTEPISTALVLPFDILLWQAVLELRALQDESVMGES